MIQAFPLTLLSEILDESMTQREVFREARNGLIPALERMRLELVNLHTIRIVERDDKLHVAITVDVYGGCKYCGGTIGKGRRTLCGQPACLTQSERDRRAHYRTPSELETPRHEREWGSLAARREQVAALTRAGLSVRQIAIRVLGTDSRNAMKAVQRDRAILRARTAA